MANVQDEFIRNLGVQNARLGISDLGSVIPFTLPLTEDGVLFGNTDATGDYSGTPTNFEIRALPAGEGNLIVTRVIIYVEDNGSIDSGNYGNNITLTNGIHATIRQNGQDIMFPFTIFTNPDYLINFAGTQQLIDYGGGQAALRTVLDFDSSAYIPLRQGTDDNIRLVLNDDFTNLEAHRFTATGFRRA